MGNNAYDADFDYWGQKFNVDPQLGKTIFHLESGGGVNTGASLPNDPDSPIGPMQMRPSTAAAMAKLTGAGADPRDIKQAIPMTMAYLAQGLNATQSPSGALAYYFAGPDQSQWGPKTQAYVQKGQALYPALGLTNSATAPATVPAAVAAPPAPDNGAPPVATKTAAALPGEDLLNAYTPAGRTAGRGAVHGSAIAGRGHSQHLRPNGSRARRRE